MTPRRPPLSPEEQRRRRPLPPEVLAAPEEEVAPPPMGRSRPVRTQRRRSPRDRWEERGVVVPEPEPQDVVRALLVVAVLVTAAAVALRAAAW